MEGVLLSLAFIEVLREISQTGFEYTPTKTLCTNAGWQLIDDEPGFYVRYDLPCTDGSVVCLSVQVAESGDLPWAFAPLFYFSEYGGSRDPFDRAFRSLLGQLVEALGAPTRVGEYNYQHRGGWSYSFAGWSLPDTTLLLVQDEFDIQFGMDVTLWVQPGGTSIQAPVVIK